MTGGAMAAIFARKNEPYKNGELEVILSMVPTTANIGFLSELLERSPSSIRIVYRIAYGYGPFAKKADVQRRKIVAAKKRVEMAIGPMPRS
jgi:hypothetical protein